MNSMEERDWLMLKVLYHTKNMTKAAAILFISQPAITNRLRLLEKEFGITIVNRGSKGIQFTPQGEYLAKSAEDILLRIRQIKDQVLNMEGEVTGTLRLGASNFFTKYRLPGLLKHFRNQYPNVDFKVTTTWSKDVFRLLSNQDVQIGFIRGGHIWNGETHQLFEEPICLTSKDEIDIHDLPNLPRIDYQTDPINKTLLDNWWREKFSHPPLISMDVDRLDTCKEMVVNGLGYAFMPSTIVNEADNIRKIIMTDNMGNPLLRRTLMIYQRDSLETRVVKEFVNFVKDIDFQSTV
jgi:DNA-binding transcriptional LysR family regulator